MFDCLPVILVGMKYIFNIVKFIICHGEKSFSSPRKLITSSLRKENADLDLQILGGTQVSKWVTVG